MLKKLVTALAGRLYPRPEEQEDGTGHCHEAAFDADSFPEEMRKKLTAGQKKDGRDTTAGK